jgi:hypothetical protein
MYKSAGFNVLRHSFILEHLCRTVHNSSRNALLFSQEITVSSGRNSVDNPYSRPPPRHINPRHLTDRIRIVMK